MTKIGFCFGLTCNLILIIPPLILIFLEKYREALTIFIVILAIQCCTTGCYMFIKETCKELIKLEIEELQEDLTSEEFKEKINGEIGKKIRTKFHKNQD